MPVQAGFRRAYLCQTTGVFEVYHLCRQPPKRPGDEKLIVRALVDGREMSMFHECGFKMSPKIFPKMFPEMFPKMFPL